MVELHHHNYTLDCVVNHWDWVSQSLSESVSEWASQWVTWQALVENYWLTACLESQTGVKESFLSVCLSVCYRVTDVLEWDKRPEQQWWRRVDPDAFTDTLRTPIPPRCLSGTEPTDNKKGTIKVPSRVESLIFAPVAFTTATDIAVVIHLWSDLIRHLWGYL